MDESSGEYIDSILESFGSTSPSNNNTDRSKTSDGSISRLHLTRTSSSLSTSSKTKFGASAGRSAAISPSNLESEEEQIRKLNDIYPSSIAFKDYSDSTRSLGERKLEHELEVGIQKLSDLIDARRKAYIPSSGEPHSCLPTVTEIKDVFEQRSDRAKKIKQIAAIPEIESHHIDADILQQEVNLAAEKRNTKKYVCNLLREFNEKRSRSLLQKRYKILFRWSRFCNGAEALERCEPYLRAQLRNIEKEYHDSIDRAERYSNKNLDEENFHTNDFRVYLRSTVYDIKTKKRLHRFFKKMKWVLYSQRYDLFAKASEAVAASRDHVRQQQSLQGRASVSNIPLMPTTLKEIEDQLAELKKGFDLTRMKDDGQEFFYTVHKRFAAVFNAQCAALVFPAYDLDVIAKNKITSMANQENNKKTGEGASKNDVTIYLKQATWIPLVTEKPRVSQRQEVQSVKLEDVSIDVDSVLRVESGFLDSTDLAYVTQRLKSQAENHLQRARIGKLSLNKDYKFGMSGDMASTSLMNMLQIDDTNWSLNKMASVYLLRYIRIREFKRKLLDILNYFRSIQRRLTLDERLFAREGAPRDGGASEKNQIRDYFLSATDLPTQEDIMQMNSIENRDDKYVLHNSRDLLVQDSNGVFIVYNAALRDMQDLEQDLLNLGTFFIRAYNGDVEVDRLSVLEDLYESETWFQDGKRKIIDCYMEAYENTIVEEDRKRLSQSILDVMALRPHIDLDGEYFSDSYAAEIIGLELQHSLMREIINYQINEERRAIQNTYKKLSQAGHRSDRDSAAGYPDNIIPREKEPLLWVNLFPGSSKASIFDFYSSLSELTRLPLLLEEAIQVISRTFGCNNPLAISAIRREFLQQAIVEWRLLIEEDKIQRNIRLKHVISDGSSVESDGSTSGRQTLEDTFLLEDAESICSLVWEIALDHHQREQQQQSQTVTTSRDGGILATASNNSASSNAPLPTTEGGFIASNPQSTSFQLFANAIEVVFLHKNLLDALYETDILYNIYKSQAKTMGRNVKKSNLSPVQFENDTAARIETEAELEQPVDVGEVVSLKTEFLSNLAIAEFENSMAEFNFQLPDGVKRVLGATGLEEFRRTFQVQVLQRVLLSVVIQYNQIPLDQFYMAKLKKFFTGSGGVGDSDEFSPSNRSSIDHLRTFFLSINSLKLAERKNILNEYKHRSADILNSRHPDLIRKKIRALKYQLVGEYCSNMMGTIRQYALRTQIVGVVQLTRSIVQKHLSKLKNPFTLGTEEDELMQTRKDVAYDKSTCILAADGTVVDLWYLPHYSQIMSLRFDKKWYEEEQKQKQKQQQQQQQAQGYTSHGLEESTEILVLLLKISQSINLLLMFALAHCKMGFSSAQSESSEAYQQVGHELRKISNEVNNLANPSNPIVAHHYLRQKCEYFFVKMLTALHTLHNKFTLQGNHPASLVIQDHINKFTRSQYRTPHGTGYWPMAQQLQSTFDERYPESNYEYLAKFYGIENQYIPFMHLNTFLLYLSDAERNYYHGEVMALELLMDDLLTEENVYSTSQAEEALALKLDFLRLSLSTLHMKEYYLARMSATFVDDDVKKRHANLEALFKERVVAKARLLCEMEMAAVPGSSESLLIRPKIREMDFRKKQELVLRQEINKLLLEDSLAEINRVYAEATAQIDAGIQHKGLSTAPHTKLAMVSEFMGGLSKHCINTRTKDGEPCIKIQEAHLYRLLDQLASRVAEWREEELAKAENICNARVTQMKHTIFNLEQKILQLESMRELDRKALTRRVHAEVTDKSYDLVFKVDSLNKKNAGLHDYIAKLEENTRQKVKLEYEELVKNMTKELMITKGKFQEYKDNLHRDVQRNLSEISDEAMMKMAQAENAPAELKKKALKIAKTDSEISSLKEKNDELKLTISKLRMWSQLKLINMKLRTDRIIQKLTEEKEAESKLYWGTKEKIEERELLLRQQLIETQNNLSTVEMECERLRKDLELQKKNKAALVRWKVANAQLLEELAEKVKKFERWTNIDVDKLLLDLQKKEQEIKQLTNSESRALRRNELDEQRKNKEIKRLQTKLASEQRLKLTALSKLDTIRTGSPTVDETIASSWHKKYFAAANRLHKALRENEILRAELQKRGIELPKELFEEEEGGLAAEGLVEGGVVDDDGADAASITDVHSDFLLGTERLGLSPSARTFNHGSNQNQQHHNNLLAGSKTTRTIHSSTGGIYASSSSSSINSNSNSNSNRSNSTQRARSAKTPIIVTSLWDNRSLTSGGSVGPRSPVSAGLVPKYYNSAATSSSSGGGGSRPSSATRPSSSVGRLSSASSLRSPSSTPPPPPPASASAATSPLGANGSITGRGLKQQQQQQRPQQQEK